MCWKTQLNKRGSKDVCVRVWLCSAPAGRCCRAAPCWGSCPGTSVQLWWGVRDPCSAVDMVSVPGTPGPSALPQGPGPTGHCCCARVRGCWASAAHTVQLQMGLGFLLTLPIRVLSSAGSCAVTAQAPGVPGSSWRRSRGFVGSLWPLCSQAARRSSVSSLAWRLEAFGTRALLACARAAPWVCPSPRAPWG